MTALFAFLASPIGRWVAAGLAVVALAAGLIWWDAARIARHEDAATAACEARWRAEGVRAEAEARAAIRATEEAAYRKGVADTQARAADTAERETETETIIREVVRNVPASCIYDAAAADQLNRLRRDP